MDKKVQRQLAPVLSRQQFVRVAWLAAWGLLLGSAPGLFLAAANWLFDWQLAGWIPVALPLVGSATAAIVGCCWQLNWQHAASAVDARYALKDRASTALEFSARSHLPVVERLAFADALDHLQSIKPHEVVPWHMPRVLPYAAAAFIATLSLVIVGGWNRPATASKPAPLDVVIAQAERAAAELTELEQYAEKEKDEDLKKLVKELAVAIEELKQPGTDVREALAKLSEMQAALQSEQAKRNPVSMDAQFQAVGEALALAEQLSEAGQALSAGQYEKAAEQLAKAEAPELDRATEKAVKEKLEKAAKQADSSGQNSLSNALSQMSSGLGNDRKGFSEGSQKLAGEASKQGKRKKLHDLLTKQCNCLGECKGECECESTSKNKSKSNKPGGKNWGLAGSDGELGERTAKLGGKQEKIKGQQSGEGEVETETTHSPEGSQQSQREYRENYAKYKKISEDVLDSEPIPLGHRQTIRRYFESIRPNDAETDASSQLK
ncbi:hypothetical protein [Anatilimnocola floriformis]|uniref:hypothetical protein n=1 Tax=Anatilimnocola floriformis TaxID=2948575 RepID=UPI0020C3FECB|nr:hypothetical protein [Anatilimnocola floriformis]